MLAGGLAEYCACYPLFVEAKRVSVFYRTGNHKYICMTLECFSVLHENIYINANLKPGNEVF